MPIRYRNPSDWDAFQSESGVVHEDVDHTDYTDAGDLRKGYSAENPYLNSDLTALWLNQEDVGSIAYDFSDEDNDGSITGVTLDQTGLLGTSSYLFDGVDDEVVVQDDPSLDPGTSDFSIAIWFRTPDAWWDTGSSNRILLDKSGNNQFWSSGSTLSNWSLGVNKRSYGLCGGYAGLDIYTDITTGRLNTGTWYFGALTYSDQDGGSIYLDADLKETNSTSGNTNSNSRNVEMGSLVGGDRFYEGKIAGVWFYTTELTSSQIQEMYDIVATPGTLTTDSRTLR